MTKRYFRLDGYLYREEANHLGPLSEGAEEITEADYHAYTADIEAKRKADDEAEEARAVERRAKRKSTATVLAKRFLLSPEETELLFGVL